MRSGQFGYTLESLRGYLKLVFESWTPCALSEYTVTWAYIGRLWNRCRLICFLNYLTSGPRASKSNLWTAIFFHNLLNHTEGGMSSDKTDFNQQLDVEVAMFLHTPGPIWEVAWVQRLWRDGQADEHKAVKQVQYMGASHVAYFVLLL